MPVGVSASALQVRPDNGRNHCGVRGPGDVADSECAAVVVGVGAAGDLPTATSRTGTGGRVAGRRTVLRPVRAVLRSADRPAERADGDLPAGAVPQAPPPAGL